MIEGRKLALALFLVAIFWTTRSSAATCAAVVSNDARSKYSILSVRALAANERGGSLVYDGLDHGEIYPGRDQAVSWECTGPTESYELRAYPNGPGRPVTLKATPATNGRTQFLLR